MSAAEIQLYQYHNTLYMCVHCTVYNNILYIKNIIQTRLSSMRKTLLRIILVSGYIICINVKYAS